jgi:hypothetical protein
MRPSSRGSLLGTGGAAPAVAVQGDDEHRFPSGQVDVCHGSDTRSSATPSERIAPRNRFLCDVPHAAWGCCSANRTGSRYGPQELELPKSQQRVVVSAFTKALGNPDELISLAGLNPLADENRLFYEDANILVPAVAAARENSINVHGSSPQTRSSPLRSRASGTWSSPATTIRARTLRGGLRRRRREHHRRSACRPRLGGPWHGVRHRGAGYRPGGEPRAVNASSCCAGSGLGPRLADRAEEVGRRTSSWAWLRKGRPPFLMIGT